MTHKKTSDRDFHMNQSAGTHATAPGANHWSTPTIKFIRSPSRSDSHQTRLWKQNATLKGENKKHSGSSQLFEDEECTHQDSNLKPSDP
jgi:hypothetical protein